MGEKMPLSLLAAYDDLIRCTNVLTEGACEQEFLRFALNQEGCRRQWLESANECKRLQLELNLSNRARSDLETKLHHARRLLDVEKKKRRVVEDERDGFEKQIGLVRDLVFVEGKTKINDETKEKLAFLNNTTVHSRGSHGFVDATGRRELSSINRLNTINEALDSTGSLLSDLSFSRSEDDLDVSLTRNGRAWRKHRPSLPGDDPSAAKRRRSGGINKSIEVHEGELSNRERLVATTTVTVSGDGPMTATAKIESIPESEPKIFSARTVPPLREIQPTAFLTVPRSGSESAESEESIITSPTKGGNFTSKPPISPSPFVSGVNIGKDRVNNRGHIFVHKTMIRPETCEPCGRKIRFGTTCAKCRDCRASVHIDCKEQLPLPCVPVTNTPNKHKGYVGVIADFTPTVPPMIPALILHCINEVEHRGLTEVGLYRIPGSEKDVKALRDKFLRSRGSPNLSGVDVHVLCGTVKDFLRSLREPLVTQSLWSQFMRATACSDPADSKAILYQVVRELPQPNRDTLAYMLLHLQRVSECPEVMMPPGNLARVFGPTLVGYSSSDLEPLAMVSETKKMVAVVEIMMSLPSSFWSNFVNMDPQLTSQQTPDHRNNLGAENLPRHVSNSGSLYRGFVTPLGSRYDNCRSDSEQKSFKNKKFFSQI